MADRPSYFHVEPEGALPEVAHLAPFRVVVVVDAIVTAAWRAQVSAWLVRSGCLYMMAWGRAASLWDDTVDMANLEQFEFGDIPDDRFVFTTWHADESLSEAMSFCKHQAVHPTVRISHTVLLHVAEHADATRLLATFADARFLPRAVVIQ